MLVCLLVPASVAFCEKNTGDSSIEDAHASRGVRGRQEGCCHNCQWGVEFTRFRLCSCFYRLTSCHCAPQFHSNLRVRTSNAATRRRQYACHRPTTLLRVAYASRVRRCTFRSSVQLFCSRHGRYHRCREIRVRRGATPWYPWRTNTLCTLIFGFVRPRN